MSVASLAQILPFAADTLGLDLQRERPLLVKRVNFARHLLFTFANAREAFAKASGVGVATLYRRSLGGSSYVALTLPAGVLTLDKLRLNGCEDNIDIFAPHQQPRRGDCPRKAVHVAGHSLFACEFQCGDRTPYFKATDPADYGKRMGIEYSTCCGMMREDLALGCDAIAPTETPNEILRLTLPATRQGWVIAEDKDGLELASYHPKVQPGFVRYALHGINPGTVLEWWGTREVFDVVFDSDQVEFADPSLWDELLRFAKLKRKDTRSASEQRTFQDTSQFLASQIEQALTAQQGDREHLTFHHRGTRQSWDNPMRMIDGIR